MEYLPKGSSKEQSLTMICCECGVTVPSNPSNLCVGCLRNEVDISEGIPKQGTLYFCRNCERYLNPPASWVTAALETKELLALCLKRIKGIDKEVRLVDAGFIWTEPHSKRIKVKVVIQKEVQKGAILQQTFIVEFTIHNQMCDDCHRVEAKDYWKACVQIRQRTIHKKTLLYLEQLILKHKAHTNTTNIKQVDEGLDFYYQHPQEAKKMMDFLQAVVPCRSNDAKELVSHDARSNIYNYKYTFSAEIVPLCKDNIVCLPIKVAQHLGNIGQICIIVRVTQVIHLIEPTTKKMSDMRADVFWRNPFITLCHPKQFIEYSVVQVEETSHNLYRQNSQDTRDKNVAKSQGAESNKHVLGDVWVVKSSELGISEPLYCRTHLGHLLNIGDTVLGFDLRNSNVNDPNLDQMKPEQIPDVILVKKVYGDSIKRARKRKWRLHHLEKENDVDTTSRDRDYHDFLEDLEEDQEYRQNINIYKARHFQIDTDDTDDDEAPKISLAEMLDELHINQDATGAEGDAMME